MIDRLGLCCLLICLLQLLIFLHEELELLVAASETELVSENLNRHLQNMDRY
jgi:hypothetical protein